MQSFSLILILILVPGLFLKSRCIIPRYFRVDR
jgi:hypothetical protein